MASKNICWIAACHQVSDAREWHAIQRPLLGTRASWPGGEEYVSGWKYGIWLSNESCYVASFYTQVPKGCAF